MDDVSRRFVKEVYGRLLHISNDVLHKCKKFKIELLKMENPSIEEIAEQLAEAAAIIWAVSDDFPDDAEGFHVAAKATEYANQIKLIAKAIQRDNQDELHRLVEQLDGRPFL